MAGQVDKSKLGGFSYRISIEVWIQPLPVESLSVAEKGNNEVQKNTDQKDHKSGKVVREEQLLKVEEDNWIEGGHREHMQILHRRAFLLNALQFSPFIAEQPHHAKQTKR